MNGSQPCARMTPADASHPVQNRISLTRGVTSILRPHTPILAHLTHGPWHRAYTPLTASSSSDSRRTGGAQGRVVRGSPRIRRTERIVRAFPGPGSGADDGHDRPSSRSGWADRRPIPPERRRASTQGSHLSPLTVRAPGSQRRGDEPHCFADYPRRGLASPLQLPCPPG
jgi:hypothetical protein